MRCAICGGKLIGTVLLVIMNLSFVIPAIANWPHLMLMMMMHLILFLLAGEFVEVKRKEKKIKWELYKKFPNQTTIV